MKKKGIIVFFIIITLIVAGYFVISRIFEEPSGKKDFFDPGDRYQSDRLDYMDVIFENESDIGDIRGCWSSTMSYP